jgi:hypothetical protein
MSLTPADIDRWDASAIREVASALAKRVPAPTTCVPA